ncbi:histidine kinase, dimerization and phosphoacceptor region [Bifidobacterium saguini DSM 23967]|uniref:Histidine kinase, dimerization and phosphoacceptor region n=2 Tax=Bifidobacterium saguini TaxID=762210 RepID=A0A087DA23_9BIFI|nr:histidine kinase [Bifidobacterium saguini]KFI92373.1 histidine kinase, dimerization and phosphoacceptor region [Bifidobacterium saguini DSM 23967]QTB91072.1 two-component sensor histidine kinase [Bifidobacterium saguini]
MRTMVEKGLLLMFSLALMLTSSFVAGSGSSYAYASGPYVELIAGMLIAISATGLAEWRARHAWAWLPACGYAIAAMVLPLWIMFLPVIAYDAAKTTMPLPSLIHVLSRTSTPKQPSSPTAVSSVASSSTLLPQRVPLIGNAISRWLWLVSIAIAAGQTYFGAGTWARTFSIRDFAIIAGACVLGFALGSRAKKETALRHTLRVMQDHERQSVRAHRLRLADIDEERAQSIRMATLGERTRIAREIHDNVGHLLTRAIMQAQAGKAVADATNDVIAAQNFAALGGTLDDAMTMVRKSVHDLEDDGTDFAAQIKDAVASFDDISPGFSVRLVNDIVAAPAPVSRCLSTVIRESLTNVVRHSEAQNANVTLRDFPAFWQLVVQDDGPAKHPSNISGLTIPIRHELPRGMGLADIDSRVRSIGGTATCGPYNQGWRVFASIPKQPWMKETKER